MCCMLSGFLIKIFWYLRLLQIDFLRNMVRAIVGTMLDIGMGKISSDDIKKIISN